MMSNNQSTMKVSKCGQRKQKQYSSTREKKAQQTYQQPRLITSRHVCVANKDVMLHWTSYNVTRSTSHHRIKSSATASTARLCGCIFFFSSSSCSCIRTTTAAAASTSIRMQNAFNACQVFPLDTKIVHHQHCHENLTNLHHTHCS